MKGSHGIWGEHLEGKQDNLIRFRRKMFKLLLIFTKTGRKELIFTNVTYIDT